MSYAIMRVGRINDLGKLSAASNHNTRAPGSAVPNADPGLSSSNRLDGVAGPALLDTVRARIDACRSRGERVRSNSVVALEVVMTTSPEWWGGIEPCDRSELPDWTVFQKRAEEWVRKEFGEKNLLQLAVHYDESTPHIHALVFPETVDGRMSAKELAGGPARMRELQTSFAAAVADLGLQRGVEKSKAKHQSVKKFYGQLDAASEALSRLERIADQLSPKQQKAVKNEVDNVNKVLAAVRGQAFKKPAEKNTLVKSKDFGGTLER